MTIDQVETHAANAGIVERADVVRLDVEIDDRHPAQTALLLAQRIEQRAVVGAVDAGLHEHRAAHSKHLQQVKVVAERRIRRRIDALLGIREDIGRTANVRVGIARALWKGRARRMRIPVGRGARLISRTHLGHSTVIGHHRLPSGTTP